MSGSPDVLFRRATVVDGTGAAPFVADVGVVGDRVAFVGSAPAGAAAGRTVDCSGLCLAPGFVDVHTHDDHLPFVDPEMGSVLRQGVTSVVVGNCGDSLWPPGDAVSLGPYLGDLGPDFGRSWRTFGEYLAATADCRPGANVAALVGHGAVRGHVLGERRRAEDGDLRKMAGLVRAALDDGAVGLSTGLIYRPGLFAGIDELVAVAGPVAERGGLYTSHVRGEGPTLFEAVREALDVGRRADVPVHVSHLKLAAESVWARTDELLDLIHEAGATGDQYPYTAGLTDLAELLPPWATPDTFPALRADGARLKHLEHVISHGEPGWVGAAERVPWECLVPVPVTKTGAGGEDLAALAARRGTTPVEALLDVLESDPDALVLIHGMREQDVRAIMRDPEVMVASDSVPAPDDARWDELLDHPRSYGAFPRVLGHYVRDEGVLPLETAVRKMTSLPADRFGLRGRGRVAAGAFADLTLFDPAAIAGGGDFARPHTPPEGVRLVLVNGRVAWEGATRERAGGTARGSATRERAGRVLRRA